MTTTLPDDGLALVDTPDYRPPDEPCTTDIDGLDSVDVPVGEPPVLTRPAKSTRRARPSVRDIALTPLPEDATTTELKMRALALRVGLSYTYDQIATELGCSVVNARRWVLSATKEVVRTPTDAMVERQRAILLDLTTANYADARAGNTDAGSMVMRCLEHEAKLYGLYAPARVNVGISESQFAEQAAELLKLVGDAPLRELAGLPTTTPAQVASATRAASTVDSAVIDAEVVSDPDAGDSWSNV